MSSNDSSAPGGASSRRSELKRAYKENPPAMGVFAVRNLRQGKVMVGSALNVPGALNRLRFELTQGMHRKYPALQEDWNRLGADAFSFEVLDVLEPPEEPGTDLGEELRVLEALWMERLRPYGDAGYHPPPKPSAS
ncbi:GIY-YIG nuclease family protein [Cystobacter fuscus]|uniref:GIY-YIG nuclease family protein n=1 Tax=Cystobacter fuscus TaxID=43 RepID=UPI0037BF0DFC